MKIIKINYENHQDEDHYYTYMTSQLFYTNICYSDKQLEEILKVKVKPREKDNSDWYPMYKVFDEEEFEQQLESYGIYPLKQDISFSYYLSDVD